MPELSQDAIRELRQCLPLLERLKQIFLQQRQRITEDEQQQLKKAYDRIAGLTSYDNVSTWVGWMSYKYDEWPSRGSPICDRLYLYVQGILQIQELEETLNRLTQENASLKEQLDELRQSESTYLSIIREAQTSPTYSLPPKSEETLLDSLQRRRESLTKNLWRYEEQKAQYGPLDVPPYILNAIEQVHEELKPVESTIDYLKAHITEMK
jgi:DNA repair exonuclease SbcCD ATPase subunit